MISVRHRRRLRTARFLAVTAPVTAIALTVTAYELHGRWWWVAAGAGAGLSLLLGAAIFRLDRRWRVDYSAGRAAQAATYAAEYERHAEEHRSFVAHMLDLLDTASERIAIQRMTLDLLQSEIAALRSAAVVVPEKEAVAKGPGHVIDMLGEVPEWTELWPEAPEAPTVVDLVVWDERSQAHRDTEIVERSA